MEESLVSKEEIRKTLGENCYLNDKLCTPSDPGFENYERFKKDLKDKVLLINPDDLSTDKPDSNKQT